MKICSKCKVEKDLSFFCKNKARNDGLAVYCKKCSYEYNKKHGVDREKKNAYDREYRKLHPDQFKSYSNKWRSRNHDRVKESQRKRQNKAKELVTDAYIRRLLCGNHSGINKNFITQEIIELHRIQINIRRLLNEKSKNEHSVSS